jgi:gas vesicle protein
MRHENDDRAFYAATCLSFVAGALAGAAVGFLLAPASGQETRDLMSRRLNETADAARGTRDKLLRKGAEAVRAVSQKGEETAQGIVSGLKTFTERTS